MKFLNFQIIKKKCKFNKNFVCCYYFLNKITFHIPVMKRIFNNKIIIYIFFFEKSSYFGIIKSLMVFLKIGNKCFLNYKNHSLCFMCIYLTVLMIWLHILNGIIRFHSVITRCMKFLSSRRIFVVNIDFKINWYFDFPRKLTRGFIQKFLNKNFTSAADLILRHYCFTIISSMYINKLQ